MSKIVTIFLGNLFRHLVTALIAFFVARHMLSEDVAHKLYAGDTVELWGGAWTVNIKQVVDFLTLAVVPVLIPVLLGAWVRIKDAYAIWIARITPKAMTGPQLKADLSDASATEIFRKVAQNPS